MTVKTEQMSRLADRGIAYAFLPIDGFYNMDVYEAIECAKLIKAQHTVPIHMLPGKLFDREKALLFDVPGSLILEPGVEMEL